jgi:hypothetical protein
VHHSPSNGERRCDGTTEPVTFYGVNPEHEENKPFVEFSGAANARILGFKEEGAATLVSQSHNVMIAAHTGDTQPQVQVVDSQDVLVATFGAYDGFGSPSALAVSATNKGTTTGIAANNRCSLFSEGHFDGTVFSHCGDAVCDGSETMGNCPQDCASSSGMDAGTVGDGNDDLGGIDAGDTGPDAGTQAEPPAHMGGCAYTLRRGEVPAGEILALLIAVNLFRVTRRKRVHRAR